MFVQGWAETEWEWFSRTPLLQASPRLYTDGLSTANCSAINTGGSFWTYNQVGERARVHVCACVWRRYANAAERSPAFPARSSACLIRFPPPAIMMLLLSTASLYPRS